MRRRAGFLLCLPALALLALGFLWPFTVLIWMSLSRTDDGGTLVADLHARPLLHAAWFDRAALLWRGRATGGSSTINGQIAILAVPDDLDRWAAQGCVGWGWDDVLPYFRKLETNKNFPDASYHGDSGPIPVYRASIADWGHVDRALREASLRLDYGWCDDHNAPTGTGASSTRSTRSAAVGS